MKERIVTCTVATPQIQMLLPQSLISAAACAAVFFLLACNCNVNGADPAKVKVRGDGIFLSPPTSNPAGFVAIPSLVVTGNSTDRETLEQSGNVSQHTRIHMDETGDVHISPRPGQRVFVSGRDVIGELDQMQNFFSINGIYSFGGRTSELRTTALRYNSLRDDWVNLNRWTTPFCCAKAVYHWGRIWLAGVAYSDSNGGTRTHLMEYDVATGTWSNDLPSFPGGVRFRFPAIAAHSGSVFVFGGHNINGAPGPSVYSHTLEFNIARRVWTSLPNMAVPRQSATAIMFGSLVYIIGGSNPQDGVLSSVEVFNSVTGEYLVSHSIPDMNVPRSYFASAILTDGTIIVLGGDIGSGNTDTIESYNLLQGGTSWTLHSQKLPGQLSAMGSALYEGQIYVFGGILPGQQRQRTVFRVDPTTLNTTTLGTFPDDLYDVAVVSIENVFR